MFLDEKHLKITKSHNTTNYYLSMLQAWPCLDAKLGLDIRSGSGLLPKLHVQVNLFAAYQKWGITSKGYWYWQINLQVAKDAELSPKAKRYK